MLARIEAEPDREARIALLARFADSYPESNSLLPVLQNLLSAHLLGNEYYKAIAVGQRILDGYPANAQAAEQCLDAAEKAGDFELTRKYADETWRRAAALPKSSAADAETARRLMARSEYSLSLVALQSADPRDRQLAMALLARLNPASPYLPNAANTTADRLSTTPGTRRAAPKDIPFPLDLDNEDVLIAEAERLTRRGDSYAKVLDYSRRALRILADKTTPTDGSDPDAWQKKRARYITAAQWMSGMAATILGQYRAADRDLRAALPGLEGNHQALSITLYSLGFVNYRLAEDGDRKRIFDALKFNTQCASIPGAYREQARKNNQSIRMYYNMRDD